MVYLGASFDMNPTNLLAASIDLLAEQAFSCRPRRETPLLEQIAWPNVRSPRSR